MKPNSNFQPNLNFLTGIFTLLMFLFLGAAETTHAQVSAPVEAIYNQTIGGTHGYRIRRIGANSPSFSVNSNFVYYPASALKTLQHFYAMSLVQNGTWNLNTTNIRSCIPGNACDEFAFTDPTCTQPLDVTLTNMMVPSNNNATNAIQEAVGQIVSANHPQVAAIGRSAINNWAVQFLGFNYSSLRTRFGCVGACGANPNQFDLGTNEKMYQKIAGNAILDANHRVLLKDLMLNESNSSFIMNVINEEANDLNKAGIINAFRAKTYLIRKGGSWTCGGMRHITSGGLIQLPTYGGGYKRLFTWGNFADGVQDVNIHPDMNADVQAELLRPAIRGALLTWGGPYSGVTDLQNNIDEMDKLIIQYRGYREVNLLNDARNALTLSLQALNGTATAPGRDYAGAMTNLATAVDLAEQANSSLGGGTMDSIILWMTSTGAGMAKDAEAYVLTTGDGSDLQVVLGQINEKLWEGMFYLSCDSCPPAMQRFVDVAVLAQPRINWSNTDLGEYSNVLGFAPATSATGGTRKTGAVKGMNAWEVEAWPNPATDHLNVRIADEVEGSATATLYDLQGRILTTQTFGDRDAGPANTITFELNAFTSGTVILKVTSAQGSISKMINIQH